MAACFHPEKKGVPCHPHCVLQALLHQKKYCSSCCMNSKIRVNAKANPSKDSTD